jgi:hypothetical protein
MNFSISCPDSIKFFLNFADTIERGDRGAKGEETRETEGDFMDNSTDN